MTPDDDDYELCDFGPAGHDPIPDDADDNDDDGDDDDSDYDTDEEEPEVLYRPELGDPGA